MAVYLDCAATMPIDPRVAETVRLHMEAEFGNAGSRTHEFGARARRAVERARQQVAVAVGAGRGEVIFTSGATEANNLAILGLAEHGRATERTHIISTRIEHNAVLEPLRAMEQRGFEVTYLSPAPGGFVEPGAVKDALTERTLLVSVMHVNNETGIIQPIEQIAQVLGDHPAFFHVDAAQSFGRLIAPLRHPRVDMMSLSGHKVHGPQGVGALIARRRAGQRPPLSPLMYGGGQELGLRPGTLAVPLIAGFGLAAELAVKEADARAEACARFRRVMLEAIAPLEPVIHGDPFRGVPHIVNLSIPGVDNETLIEAVSELIAISDGAACSSASKTCSHVLSAMGVDAALSGAGGAVRLSWCHMTQQPDWPRVVEAIEKCRPGYITVEAAENAE